MQVMPESHIAMTKSTRFDVRCSDEQKARWASVAKMEGRSLASWIRWVLDREAIREFEKSKPCEGCGLPLPQSDIDTGLSKCFWCETPWDGP